MEFPLRTCFLVSVWLYVAFLATTTDAATLKDSLDLAQPSTHQKLKPIDCKQLLTATASQGNTSWTPICNTTTNVLKHVQVLKSGQKFCVDIYTTGVLLGPTPTANDAISCKCATQAKFARLRALRNSSSTYVPQCDKISGQFLATQCDTTAQQCWCVDNEGKVASVKWSTANIGRVARAANPVKVFVTAATPSICMVPAGAKEKASP